MALEIPGFTFAREAAVDLSASQYCAVASDANGRLVLPAAGALCLGVLQNKPASLGAEGSVMVDGVTKMLASAAITVGSPVTVDAAGKANSTLAAGNQVIGVALTAAAAANEVISVLMVRYKN